MIAIKLRPVTATLLDWTSQRSIDVKCQWDTQTSMLLFVLFLFFSAAHPLTVA